MNNPMPRVINVDKNRSCQAAVESLKQEGIIRQRCQLRQCKYLNNVVEQDHRKCETANLARETRSGKYELIIGCEPGSRRTSGS